jgi:uncharacterized membrane protein
VSLLGTGAALAGALSVACAALVAVPPGLEGAGVAVLATTLGGGAGMAADSLLGATLQARYWDPDAHAAVEVPGPSRRLVGGLPGVGNDVVNGVGTAVGALGAVLAWSLL